jgi:hypothetical protein
MEDDAAVRMAETGFAFGELERQPLRGVYATIRPVAGIFKRVSRTLESLPQSFVSTGLFPDRILVRGTMECLPCSTKSLIRSVPRRSDGNCTRGVYSFTPDSDSGGKSAAACESADAGCLCYGRHARHQEQQNLLTHSHYATLIASS